jgi:hypothetical protein
MLLSITLTVEEEYIRRTSRFLTRPGCETDASASDGRGSDAKIDPRQGRVLAWMSHSLLKAMDLPGEKKPPVYPDMYRGLTVVPRPKAQNGPLPRMITSIVIHNLHFQAAEGFGSFSQNDHSPSTIQPSNPLAIVLVAIWQQIAQFMQVLPAQLANNRFSISGRLVERYLNTLLLPPHNQAVAVENVAL